VVRTPGPARRDPRRARPRADHRRDQPHLTAGPAERYAYATAATPDQLVPHARLTRPGLLGSHLTYLHQRWDEGCRSTDKLHEELRTRGYCGSLRTLRRHTAQLRQDTIPPAPPRAPAAKKVASWILTPPGKPTDDHPAALAQITGRCEEPTATRAPVRDFADMLCHRRGEHLETWAARPKTAP
jgi:hypothetical protein